MSVNLSPIGGAAAQFFDNNGNPLSGGKLYTYAAGTTTPLASYTTSAGNVPHTNPIIFDSAGRVPGGQIWLTDGSVDYKFLLETSFNVLVGTFDNIPPAISGSAADIEYLPAGIGAVATTVQAGLNALNIANVPALLLASQGVAVRMLNYHAGAEGGGGQFYWDSAKNKALHNGGTVIDPAIVFPADWNNAVQLATWFTSGSGSGCWVRQYEGRLDIKVFGCVASKERNDVPIQKMVDMGLPMSVPAETFRISNTIVLKSNTSIVGVDRVLSVINGETNGVRVVMANANKVETTLVQTADLPPGSSSMTITNTAQAGDFFRIKSTQRFTRSWDRGFAIRAEYVDSELMEVLSATASVVTFTEPTFLDFPVAVKDTVTFFTPQRNIEVSNLTISTLKDDASYSQAITIYGLSKGRFDNLLLKNTNQSGLALNYSMDVSVTDLYTDGGTATLGLNYGISINDGSKHINVTNIYGKANRHAIAGGGTGYAIPMYVNANNIHCAAVQSFVADAHANCANFHYTNIFGNVSMSGIGHVCENVTTTGGQLYLAYEGGFDLTFTNILGKNLTQLYTNEAINDSRFTNINLSFRNPTLISIRTASKNNRWEGLRLINSLFTSTMTAAEADATLVAGSAIAIVSGPDNHYNNVEVVGFPQAFNSNKANVRLTNAQIMNCGWNSALTSTGPVISLTTDTVQSTFENITFRNDNTTIANNNRMISVVNGTLTATNMTFSNIKDYQINPAFYSWQFGTLVAGIKVYDTVLQGVLTGVIGVGSRSFANNKFADA